jgi:primosomal replication protein N
MLDTVNNFTIKNEVTITGKLIDVPSYRVSPTGHETAHLKLWHESQQMQLTGKLELTHKVEFSIPISIAKQELISKLKTFTLNKAELNKYQIVINGYLAQRVFANGEQKLVLHANNIEIILNKF